MKKTIPLWLMALLLLFTACRGKEPHSSPAPRPMVTGVSLIRISPSLIDSFYEETTGTVKAETTSIVSARTMGTVTAVKVREGDPVRAGQALVTLDDRGPAEKVVQAEAAHQEALKALEAAEQKTNPWPRSPLDDTGIFIAKRLLPSRRWIR